LLRYGWLGKQKRISPGICPEVSLRQTRLARDKARAPSAEGVNPRLHRTERRPPARLADENTFNVVSSQWTEHRKLEIKTGKDSTHAKMVRVFEEDILPFLGKQPIHEFKRKQSRTTCYEFLQLCPVL
jgi:hypothetical protein